MKSEHTHSHIHPSGPRQLEAARPKTIICYNNISFAFWPENENVFEGRSLRSSVLHYWTFETRSRGGDSSGSWCFRTGYWMERKYGKPEILKPGTVNHGLNDWLYFVLRGNKSLNYCPVKIQAMYHLTLQHLFTSRLSEFLQCILTSVKLPGGKLH